MVKDIRMVLPMEVCLEGSSCSQRSRQEFSRSGYPGSVYPLEIPYKFHTIVDVNRSVFTFIFGFLCSVLIFNFLFSPPICLPFFLFVLVEESCGPCFQPIKLPQNISPLSGRSPFHTSSASWRVIYTHSIKAFVIFEAIMAPKRHRKS